MPCPINETAHSLWHPNPKPNIPGAADTTDMRCQFGNIVMQRAMRHKKGRVYLKKETYNTCCGVRPHFNWVVATCEDGGGVGQFCKNIPDCIKNTPKINYVAEYQYDGKKFVMLDESTAGDITKAGVSGNFNRGTGWEKVKKNFKWRGGDWTTKYAPWAKGKGPNGPRGITPPAGLWVISAENFYYAAFYMLHQLNINLEGHGQPTKTNCWLWELDPVEGAVGWHKGHTPGPGNINMLYATNNAQVSGCMPLSYTGKQMNGLRREFHEPAIFKEHCKAHPEEPGCRPWKHWLDWSGGKPGSQRWENLWDQPYVFAVVLDGRGTWTYRWIPDGHGKTGWRGIRRFKAAREIPARPRPVTDPEGLESDVRGSVKEALIFQPAVSAEGSCMRSLPEELNWGFGSETLGSIAHILGEDGINGKYAGAQNWWSKFSDTHQYADYPTSIMGVPKEIMKSMPYNCNTEDAYACDCKMLPKERDPEKLKIAVRAYLKAKKMRRAKKKAHKDDE